MLPGGARTINGRIAETMDPFRDLRSRIWELYPDPLWHLRIAGPWAGDDPYRAQRDGMLAKLPMSDFVAQQWSIEQRVLGVAGLRRITLKQEAAPPRPSSRPPTADVAALAFEVGITGCLTWDAVETQSARSAIMAGLALGKAAVSWHRLSAER